MKVLLLGSGAREHALAWKIAQSRELWKLWCAPGNPGMEQRWEMHYMPSFFLKKLLRNYDRAVVI